MDTYGWVKEKYFMKANEYKWWQTGVIYQVYPRSFKDSNGNGIGDLQGIIEKLNYLKELGVQAIWISPIYPSPMADFGYDVSDYTAINPIFGTMEDFDELLKKIHEYDLKLILDFVPNHTSDQHPWFVASRKSRDNPKRDWYIWKDGTENGGYPNNWLSEFGGSGWEYDDHTEQYYYHAYLKEQPDLNWRNPEVQQEMLKAMRFWLDKGVDGFRVDVMWHMIKDNQFRDNPPNPNYSKDQSPYRKQLPAYSTDQPKVHDIVAQMRKVTDQYHERVIIGEIYLPVKRLVVYYGQNNQGAHLPFNFTLIKLPWNAKEIEAVINEYEGSLPNGAWPNWVLGNHDNSRVLRRVGKHQAGVAAMLLLTLRGTPTMYYGDEIGMDNVPISLNQVHDPQEKNIPGMGLGRDPERTPMQWDDSDNAGFTTTEPWLPVMENFKMINVQRQWDEAGSLLKLYRDLLKIRAKELAMQVGDYTPVISDNDLLSYTRSHAEKEFLIILNFADSIEQFTMDAPNRKGEVLLSTDQSMVDTMVSETITIQPNQGLLILLEHKSYLDKRNT